MSPQYRSSRTMPKPRKRTNRFVRFVRDIPWIVIIPFVIVVVLIIGSLGIWAYGSIHTGSATITVTSKESVSKDGGHEYRVYAQDGRVFKVSDNLLHAHFSSANTYNKLRANRTYKCKTVGFRIPIISTFKNLLSCQDVTAVKVTP